MATPAKAGRMKERKAFVKRKARLPVIPEKLSYTMVPHDISAKREIVAPVNMKVIRQKVQPRNPLPVREQVMINRSVQRFKAMVLAKIEKSKVYPLIARKMRLEGDVFLRFTILSNGGVEAIEVIPPTACHNILSDAAVKTVQKGAPYTPLPVNKSGDQSTVFEVKISYKLN